MESSGALIALYIMGSPFGFMAFLGIASLIGVIVSHVIVLFDFIEEMHEKGEPLEQALLDAGIVRLRPVMITVGATILALFPAGDSRRAAVAAALLRADWWTRGGDVHHAAAGAGALLDFRARSEDCDLGQSGSAFRRETESCSRKENYLT